MERNEAVVKIVALVALTVTLSVLFKTNPNIFGQKNKDSSERV